MIKNLILYIVTTLLQKKKVSNNTFNLFEKGNIKNSRKIALDKIKLKESKNYVLKIDVDVNEFQVIRSAKFFIETKKPMILLEITRSFLSKKQFNYIINFLNKNNYNLILFNKFKISPKIVEFDFMNFGRDYLFIHKDDY